MHCLLGIQQMQEMKTANGTSVPSTTEESALRYAKKGWPVLPVHPGGKAPLGRLAPSGVKDATTDEDQIRDWWRVVPSANVGVATGRVFVIDEDEPGAWDALTMEHQTPMTLTVGTPSGGRHFYFRAPEGIEIKNSVRALAPELDVRGHGGYVIVAPSSTDAGDYVYEEKLPVADAPEWLLDAVRRPETPEKVRSEPIDDEIPEGQRNDTLTSLAGTMRRRGLSRQAMEAALLRENERRCSPPLPEREVKSIAESVARYDPTDTPFSPEKIGTLASEVEAEPTEWLWSRRLPLGELTILDGDPGTGKSTLLAGVAARITRGRGLPGHEGTPVEGGVVYITTEDSPARTLRPRLEAAGGALERTLLVPSVPDEEGDPRPLALPDDIDLLEQAVRRVRARLVVIDPLMAHLGGSINAHRDADVRRALAPLSDLAHRLGAAVVVVRHLNKSGRTAAIYRGGGSIGIIGAARVGLLLAEHPEQDDVRVLACVKNNLAVFPPSQALALEQAPEHDVARVEWLDTCDLTADELLQGDSQGRADEKRQEAREFLEEILSDGPVPAKEVQKRADEEGILTRTLRRAKEALAVEKEKDGFQGPWVWKLPDDKAPF
jgi:hypothetical protein